MHTPTLDGVWYDEGPEGSTLTLNERGDTVTGQYVGGRGHETLRGTFNGKRCQGGFEGSHENREGPVTGKGQMRVEIVGRNTIRFCGATDWSGGGTSGHVESDYIMHRKPPC